MKEGWTYKKLGEITISMADGPFGSNLKAEHYTDHKEVRIIQLSNIGEEGWREENVKYTTFEHLESIKRSEVQPDDIVIAKMMPAGRAILCPHHEKKYVLSSDAVRATLVEGVDKKFILYSINSPYFRKQVYANVSGSGRVRTSLTKLRDCSIAIPSLEVQQRIVERLDAAFENIDKLKANAEKQLAEARILFQKCLAKAMEPKEEWEEKKLKDIAQVRIGPFGSLLHKKDYISGGIPLVNPIHMVNGNIVANNDYTISDVKAKELSNYLLKENDIVFARRGEVGRCAIVTGEDEGFLCGTGSLFVRFLREIDSNFMLMLFQSDYCKNYLEHNASGATMLNINAGIVEDMPLTLPPLAVQQRIVERLDSLSENVRKYEEIQRQIIFECDALKQALLRKVFE